MANKINYAEKYSNQILEILNQETLTSPFIADPTAVEFSGAQTVHFTQNSVSGFKTHSRAGGWNRGTVTQTDKDYKIEHDRDVEFLVDRIDIDESNGTASIDNVSDAFTKTQQAPEVDARFFERVYSAASTAGLTAELDMSTLTADNVVSTIKNYFLNGKLRRYRARGSLIGYVSSEVMNLLELSTEKKLRIETTTIADGGVGIETRVTDLDGVYLFEVIDDERFYSAFDYTDGFEASSTAKELAVVLASTEVAKTVNKTKAIYIFRAGEHTEGDGDLYQNRSMWDTFVFPNGKDGTVEGIFVATVKATTGGTDDNDENLEEV